MDFSASTRVQHAESCLDPAVLAAFPHTLALNDPPGGYPVVISSFGTSSGFVLPSGNGSATNNASITGGNLVLTQNAGNQAGIGLYGQAVAVGTGVQVEFTYTSSGGSGADGIAFFVLDASQVSSASAVMPGGYGGGLGYSDDGRAGITGGVLGIGFDTYGNYSASDQGPQTGTGRSPNSIDIRGAGNASTSGYNLLDTTAFAPGIDGTRTVKVTLIPNGSNTLVSVAVSTDSGNTFNTVINNLSVAQTLPSSVYYGFSASTGGSTDLHEINAMAVQLLTDPELGPVSVQDTTTGTTNPSTIAPGDSVAYSYTVTNNGPNGSSQFALTDNAPPNLVGETWTVVDSLGTHTGTGAPDLANLNLSNGATATVTVSGRIDPGATSGNISHTITVVPGASFASSNPAGGTRTALIGAGGSSLVLQGANVATTNAGTASPVLVAPTAVVTNEASTTDTVRATVVESSTALGTLGLAAGAPLAGTLTGAGGTLSFAGTAAQVQAELRDVQFTTTAHTGSGTEGYTITLSDATSGANTTETRASTTVDAPALSGTVGVGALPDTGSDAVFANVSVSDVDATSLTATVTVNAAHGDLTAASSAGWARSATGTVVTYTRTVSASGTVAAALQAGLHGLVFQPAAHALAPNGTEQDGFALVVTDGAGTSTPTLSGTDTVTAVHDQPALSGSPAGTGITDAQGANPFAALGVVQPDNTSLVVTVTEVAAHGDLTAASAAGWARSSSGGTVSYTETFAAGGGGSAAAAAQAALQGLVFQPAAHAIPPGTTEQDLFSVSVLDGAGGTASSATGTLVVTATHDAPVVTNPTAPQTTTDLQSSSPFASASVADPDDTSITLTATLAGGQGDLTAASAAGWSRSAAGGTITYTRGFSAGTGSAAAAQAALRALAFQPAAHVATPGSSAVETFSVLATDGLGTSSAAATTTGTVTATHDTPALSGTVAGRSITDAGSDAPFANVAVTDPDAIGLTLSVTVAAGTGDLTAASAAGWIRASSGGTVTYTRAFAAGAGGAAAADAQSALQGLVFQPSAHAIALGATETDRFTVTATDAQGAASGTLAGTDTVTPTHDAPILAGAVGGQSITDVGAAQPFAATTLADPDLTPLVLVVTESAATGDLTATSAAGFARSVSGTLVSYTETFAAGAAGGSAAAAAQAALRGLVFQPAAHANPPGSTEADLFSASVSDGQGGIATTATGTVTVTSTHDLPALSGLVGGQSLTDAGTATPFAAVAVTEPDNTPLTLTVTVAAANGDLDPASAAGWTRSASGGSVTYTESFAAGTGSAAAAQAALRGLAFQPTAHALAIGSTETDAFSVSATDGSGGASMPLSGLDVVSPVHDVPLVSGGIASQAAVTGQTIQPFGGITVSDPDRVGLLAAVTVRGGAAGAGDLSSGTAGWTESVQGTDTVFTRAFAAAPGVDATVQGAIGALGYTPTLPGTTGFVVRVTDQAATPLGSTLDSTPSLSVIQGGPTVIGGGAQTVADTGTLAPLAGVTVLDAGMAPAQASVTLSGAATSGDDLTAASTAGWTRGVSGMDVVYTRSFAAGPGEQSALQSALSALVLQPAAHATAPGSVHATPVLLAVSDAYGTATAASAVTVTATTDVPALLGGTPDVTVADVETAAPFAGLTVSEPDDVAATATVTITDGLDQGDFTAASTQGLTRTVSGRDITYTLSLPAASDAGAAVQAVLSGLVFQPVRQAPGTAEATTITLATAFAGLPAPASRQVVVNSGGALYPYPDLSARDADPAAVVTVMASLPAGTIGHYATLGMGTVGTDPLTYVVTGTAAEVTAALRAVSFVPAAGSILPGSYQARISGDGNRGQLVDGGAGDNVLAATAANDTVMGGPGTDTIFGAAGSPAVLVGGSGHNAFVAGAGATTVFSGMGGSTFSAGAANAVMVQSAGQDTFYGGTGAATVFGGSGSTTVFGGAGSLQFEGGSGAATVLGAATNNLVFGGAAPVTVYGAGSGLYAGGTQGNNVLVSGMGASTLLGGGDTDLLIAQGSAGHMLAAGHGADTLTGTASDGNDLYFAATQGGHALVALGSGDGTVIGGAGADTIFAGRDGGSMTYYGGTGTDLVIGSAFRTTFVAGQGNETLLGSGGTDTVVIRNGQAGGSITIDDAGLSAGGVTLFGYAPDMVASAMAHETVAGGSSTVVLPDSTRLTFVGVSDLSALIRQDGGV